MHFFCSRSCNARPPEARLLSQDLFRDLLDEFLSGNSLKLPLRLDGEDDEGDPAWLTQPVADDPGGAAFGVDDGFVSLEELVAGTPTFHREAVRESLRPLGNAAQPPSAHLSDVLVALFKNQCWLLLKHLLSAVSYAIDTLIADDKNYPTTPIGLLDDFPDAMRGRRTDLALATALCEGRTATCDGSETVNIEKHAHSFLVSSFHENGKDR